MDIKDIRIGQIVTIKAKVKDIDKSDGTILLDTSGGILAPGPIWIGADRIASVEDAPYEPKVGDWVTWGVGSWHYQIVAIDGDCFWTRDSHDAIGSLRRRRDMPNLRKVERPND